MTASTAFITGLAQAGRQYQTDAQGNFQGVAGDPDATPDQFVIAGAEYKIALGVAQMMFDAARDTGNADKATAEGVMR